ncbi:hypothetical protein B0H17DRAFT_1212433 [Mycena rosella]|uniref:Uncharacterized protein n=1 Tax=Mycena rosella TaxID=1033263 RepID=A0AAD7CSC7_MYCRO|nr:hypothetical protein B0H17DRAFT_1212433 [Mycena rosella]
MPLASAAQCLMKANESVARRRAVPCLRLYDAYSHPACLVAALTCIHLRFLCPSSLSLARYTSSTTPPVDPASLWGRSPILSATPERNIGITAAASSASPRMRAERHSWPEQERAVRQFRLFNAGGHSYSHRRHSYAPQTMPPSPTILLSLCDLFIWLAANCVLSAFGIGIVRPGIFFLGLGNSMLGVFHERGDVCCRLICARFFFLLLLLRATLIPASFARGHSIIKPYWRPRALGRPSARNSASADDESALLGWHAPSSSRCPTASRVWDGGAFLLRLLPFFLPSLLSCRVVSLVVSRLWLSAFFRFGLLCFELFSVASSSFRWRGYVAFSVSGCLRVGMGTWRECVCGMFLCLGLGLGRGEGRVRGMRGVCYPRRVLAALALFLLTLFALASGTRVRGVCYV